MTAWICSYRCGKLVEGKIYIKRVRGSGFSSEGTKAQLTNHTVPIYCNVGRGGGPLGCHRL